MLCAVNDPDGDLKRSALHTVHTYYRLILKWVFSAIIVQFSVSAVW